MSEQATTLHFLSLPQLVALQRAFSLGMLERRGEQFYVYSRLTGRGRLLEALEAVEEEMDMRAPSEEE